MLKRDERQERHRQGLDTSPALRDALAPNLEQATRDVRPGSPDESELKKLRATALKDFDGISQGFYNSAKRP